jgi:hypothetical protein
MRVYHLFEPEPLGLKDGKGRPEQREASSTGEKEERSREELKGEIVRP